MLACERNNEVARTLKCALIIINALICYKAIPSATRIQYTLDEMHVYLFVNCRWVYLHTKEEEGHFS